MLPQRRTDHAQAHCRRRQERPPGARSARDTGHRVPRPAPRRPRDRREVVGDALPQAERQAGQADSRSGGPVQRSRGRTSDRRAADAGLRSEAGGRGPPPAGDGSRRGGRLRRSQAQAEVRARGPRRQHVRRCRPRLRRGARQEEAPAMGRAGAHARDATGGGRDRGHPRRPGRPVGRQADRVHRRPRRLLRRQRGAPPRRARRGAAHRRRVRVAGEEDVRRAVQDVRVAAAAPQDRRQPVRGRPPSRRGRRPATAC